MRPDARCPPWLPPRTARTRNRRSGALKGCYGPSRPVSSSRRGRVRATLAAPCSTASSAGIAAGGLVAPGAAATVGLVVALAGRGVGIGLSHQRGPAVSAPVRVDPQHATAPQLRGLARDASRRQRPSRSRLGWRRSRAATEASASCRRGSSSSPRESGPSARLQPICGFIRFGPAPLLRLGLPDGLDQRADDTGALPRSVTCSHARATASPSGPSPRCGPRRPSSSSRSRPEPVRLLGRRTSSGSGATDGPRDEPSPPATRVDSNRTTSGSTPRLRHHSSPTPHPVLPSSSFGVTEALLSSRYPMPGAVGVVDRAARPSLAPADRRPLGPGRRRRGASPRWPSWSRTHTGTGGRARRLRGRRQ